MGRWSCQVKNRGGKSDLLFISACFPKLCMEWLEFRKSSIAVTPAHTHWVSAQTHIDYNQVCVQVRSAATIMLSWL